MNCAACNALLSPPHRFCGVCGARQPEEAPAESTEPSELHYSGPSGQDRLGIGELVERIASSPDAAHHLWTDGWDGWKPWREVDLVARRVDARLAVLRETPEAVAEYRALVAQMAADGVIEPWEATVLEKRRRTLSISKATHDRLMEDHLQAVAQWLVAAVDAKAMSSFRAGDSCLLRVLLRNASSDGLAAVQVQIATSSTEGLVQLATPRLAPGATETVELQLRPELAGHHKLELLFTATDFYGTTNRYRSKALVFEVARAESEQGTRVYNVDLSSMQVGKIGNVGSIETSTGGLVDSTQWVQLALSSLTEAESVQWSDNRQGSAHRAAGEAAENAPKKPPSRESAPVATEAVPDPELTWHYAGPQGQEELTAEQIGARVRAAPGKEHHVWREGYDGWRAVADVPELAEVGTPKLDGGLLAGQPWVMWPEAVREWMCERVVAEAVLVPLEQTWSASRIVKEASVHRVLAGVDAHAFVRAGLTSGLGWREGRLYAIVDPAVFLATGQVARLQALEPAWPGAFGGVLQALASGEELESPLLCSGEDPGEVSSAAQAVASLLRSGEHAERLYESWFASSTTLGSGAAVRSGLQVQLRLGHETAARDHLRTVIREAAEEHDWSVPYDLWLADTLGLVFGDVPRARRRLRSASCETALELVVLAELQALLLNDFAQAKQTLRRARLAVVEREEGDDEPASEEAAGELVALAFAWKTLFGDDAATQQVLEAASAETWDCTTLAEVGAAQLMLFTAEEAASAEIDQVMEVLDESPDFKARVLMLFPDGPQRLVDWVEHEDNPSRDEEGDWKVCVLSRDQAWLLAAAGLPDRARRMVEELGSEVDLIDLDVVRSLRWVAGLPEEARSYLEEASEEARLVEDWVNLACAAVQVGELAEAARWMNEAEKRAGAADEVVLIADTWSGSLFYAPDKALRFVRNALDEVPADDYDIIHSFLASLEGDRRFPARALQDLTSEVSERIQSVEEAIEAAEAEERRAEALAQSLHEPSDWEEFSVGGESFGLRRVEAGTYMVGSRDDDEDADDDEKPRHSVRFTRPYGVGEFAVTQDVYEAVMGENPSDWVDEPDSARRPVEQVSWFDAVAFCNRLSELCGLPPAYHIGEGDPESDAEEAWPPVTCDRASEGFRLPTEHEWEVAARAGTDSEYAGADELDSVGWFHDNGGDGTRPVGQKSPNAWGLYDLSGNVWEWCGEDHHPYQSGTMVDPVGSPYGECRVVRGGSWSDVASGARVASRFVYGASARYPHLGFRLVRTLS